MPIVPHSTAGGRFCGCIVAALDGSNVELRCNECGAVLGVVHIDILKGLLGLEAATATCPQCGKENTFPGFMEVSAFVCVECGKAVAPPTDAVERVDINDDTCKWYEFEDQLPIAVMRCDRCGRHPDVDEDGVACPLCARRSPVRSTDIIFVIEAWNNMVDPGQ